MALTRVFLACSLLVKVIDADSVTGKETVVPVGAPDNSNANGSGSGSGNGNGWGLLGPGDDENDETSETKYEGEGEDGPRTVVMGTNGVFSFHLLVFLLVIYEVCGRLHVEITNSFTSCLLYYGIG